MISNCLSAAEQMSLTVLAERTIVEKSEGIYDLQRNNNDVLCELTMVSEEKQPRRVV